MLHLYVFASLHKVGLLGSSGNIWKTRIIRSGFLLLKIYGFHGVEILRKQCRNLIKQMVYTSSQFGNFQVYKSLRSA